MVRDDTLFLIGTPLSDLDIELCKSKDILKKIGQLSNMHAVQIFHQVVLNLQGKNSSAGLLKGTSYDEEKMLNIHLEANDKTCLYVFYVSKLILNYLFGNYPDAYYLSEKMMEYIDGALGSLYYAVSYFYDSLARIAYYPNAGLLLKQKILLQVRRNQKKMKKWADHAPDNFLHKYHIVEAELAKIRGADKDVVPLYQKAISGAMETGYTQEAAISCECLAGFYLDHRMEDLAASYMAKACELYQSWGAYAKVWQLNEKYNRLFLRVPGKHVLPESPDGSVDLPAPRIEDRLDIAAMMKMSQAISSEIVLEKLLVTLIRVIAENSGAEKALLILNRNGRFEIDAEIGDNAERVIVLQGVAVDESDALCPGIISYVRRTREPLVLDDARANGRFSGDPYICQHLVRSLLCLPLVRQQQVIGLIYLENNLTPNAFTPDRVEMITMLSTQGCQLSRKRYLFRKNPCCRKSQRKISRNNTIN